MPFNYLEFLSMELHNRNHHLSWSKFTSLVNTSKEEAETLLVYNENFRGHTFGTYVRFIVCPL